MDAFFQAPQLNNVVYAKYEKYAFGCDIHRGSWLVPEVQNVIDLARTQRLNSSCSRLKTLPFPLKICLLVLDIICPIEFTEFDV
ncbi:uncharacterized protein N7483_003725 [Penicillium malachiteum]|uniref:uncharacterized protein n=1 Tax=Penicillium malachiteum TaxID=1324776 RepID=UPI0025490CA9|nr:uncharacterized protein N7483_003725 [Penicillium malachiteum]KAJ5729217.1 hypothetical protein N7483_003725 [Penicillium malachiteum]